MQLPAPFSLALSIIPALPTTAKTAYLVGALDTYYDSEGNEIGYPPVHPHHSNSNLIGYPEEMTQIGNGTFANWFPWPPQTTSYAPFRSTLMKHNRPPEPITQHDSSMNSPGHNVDLLDCRGRGVEVSACGYLQTPRGWAWTVPHKTDLWSSTILNSVHGWTPKTIYMEYGRKFLYPASKEEAPKPLWTLQFAVNGCGDTYRSSAAEAAAGGQQHMSVIWHVYRMPASGHFVSGWLHTHAQMASELWVVAGDIESMLPHSLVANCYSTGACAADTGGGSRGCTSDMLLAPPLAVGAADIAERVLAKPHTLRCQYKSRNIVADGRAYGRQGLRSLASATQLGRCDNWTFSAGQHVSLLAFNHPPKAAETLGNAKHLPQHQSWMAVTAFKIKPPEDPR